MLLQGTAANYVIFIQPIDGIFCHGMFHLLFAFIYYLWFSVCRSAFFMPQYVFKLQQHKAAAIFASFIINKS